MSRNRNTRQRIVRCHAYIEIDLGAEELTEVEFTGSAIYGNFGIGHYECHGYVGNDIQMGYEVDDYEWDRQLYSEEENKIIEKFVDDNDSKIVDKLYDSIDED